MFKRLLVPIDGSDPASKAAQIAVDLAKSQSASVVGLYVIDPFPYIGLGEASSVGLQAYLAEAQAHANHALGAIKQLCEKAGVAYQCDTIERNSVYEGILDTAQAEACDLIVMGSHGRKGVEALILGSVAQKVLTHSSTPVLVVKS